MNVIREGGATTSPGHHQFEAWLDAGLAVRVLPWLDHLRAQSDPAAGLCAARAMRHLGAERQGDAFSVRWGRRHREHAGAVTALLRAVLGNRGSYVFWRCSQRFPLPTTCDDAARAERLSLEGLWLSGLRDASALERQAEALELCPTEPWLWVEHSYTLAQLDRLDDALAAAQRSLDLRPGFRTGLQQVASLMWRTQRRSEAYALLKPALAESANGMLAWQLHGMAADDEAHEQALEYLAQAEAGLPLAERRWRDLFAARRADALLHLGRLAEAREWAAQVSGTGFYSRLAETLSRPGASARRVLLPLAMVQQHWMTCAPATLTALATYWGRPVDHLEVAQAICYDGTPAASERNWARSQGFWTREFKLDWASCCALIDAGVPFALATLHVGGGHLQAVVGYDRLRRTVLIRDPSYAVYAEYDAEQLFDAQQSSGPRAMLMLPDEEVHRVAGIELPEAEGWELAHELQSALQRHDRPTAIQVLERLGAEHPGSDSLLRSQRLLAIYDGDEPRILAATDALLERFPDDRHLHQSRLSSLIEVRGQLAADAQLEAMVERFPDALTLCRWSGQLARDVRRLPQALEATRRALRLDGSLARAWSELGDRLWQQSGAAAGLQALYWASTLTPTAEWAASSYARACRIAGQPERGLSWLRERDRVWGDRSGAPAISLADELDSQQRGHEAEAVLSAALARRSSDSALRLHLAERRLRQRRDDEAAALLEGCLDVHAPALLRMRALLLEARGELQAALDCVREAVELEPLQLAHHQVLLRLLRRQLGHEAALTQWQEMVDRHPAHFGLQQLYYRALPDRPGAINAQLDRMHAHHPGNAWLQRERAIQASRQERHEAAVTLARAAVDLSAEMASSHDILAYCELRAHGYAAALGHLHEALRRDAELEGSIERLLAAPDPVQARAGADFVAAELRRQPLLGDGLLTFQSAAVSAWSADEILAFLTELSAQWPSLWQGPIAVARQLQRLQRTDEALALLADAAQGFPQLPRVHLEWALALRQAARPDDAKAACAAALALSPSWNRAVRLQVDLLSDHGRDWVEAQAVLERALTDRHGWDDADLLGLLAWVHEQQKRDDLALLQAQRSLRLDPGADWVWDLVRRVFERRESLAEFDAFMDEVVRSRPGDAAAWAVLATHGRDDLKALEAAERSLALVPRQQDVWRARFERLERLGRRTDIEALLANLPWPAPAPPELRAWSARLQWAAGQQGEALAQLTALRQELPRDESLCVLQADWLDERQDHAGYLAAARDLVDIEPLSARSQAYLGHALVKCGQWQDALGPLQQALRLVPSYAFAALQLVQAATRTRSTEIAEEALQQLWPHRATVDTACHGIEMAALAAQWPRAEAWLHRLFALDEFEIDRCKQALAACHDAGWTAALTALQRSHVAQGGGPVGVALDWLERRERRSFWAALIQAWRWQRVATGVHLQRALLRWLLLTDSRLSTRGFVRTFDASLRADDLAWGEVSYVLSSMHEDRALVRWMHDWQTRERPPVFAIGNLAGSLVALHRWDEVAGVVRATLARAPYNEDMRLWELVLLARGSDIERLIQGLARRHEWQPDDWMQPILEALDALADLATSGDVSKAVAAFRGCFGKATARQGRIAIVELRRVARQHLTPLRDKLRWWSGR